MSLEPWGWVAKEGFLEELHGAAETCWGVRVGSRAPQWDGAQARRGNSPVAAHPRHMLAVLGPRSMGRWAC